MIAISKAEKEAIKEKFPDVHIVRTMKQRSKRHRYYCEETRRAISYLNKLRGITEEYKPPVRNKRKRRGSL